MTGVSHWVNKSWTEYDRVIKRLCHLASGCDPLMGNALPPPPPFFPESFPSERPSDVSDVTNCSEGCWVSTASCLTLHSCKQFKSQHQLWIPSIWLIATPTPSSVKWLHPQTWELMKRGRWAKNNKQQGGFVITLQGPWWGPSGAVCPWGTFLYEFDC